MAKRFTATDKWRKGFFKGLSTLHKLLWLYMLDECDHAGIWDVELDVATIRIGEDVTGIKASDFGGKVIEVDGGGKWFITSFFEYQYGTFNDKVNAQKSAISRIKSQLSKKQYQGFMNPSSRVKDKDKDKDKEEDKEKDSAIAASFSEWWGRYDYKLDRAAAEAKWAKLSDAERAACLDVVDTYVLLTPDKQYRKHPTTYLNKRSWEDELVSNDSFDIELGF